MRFVDTNILVDAASTEPETAVKRTTALGILDEVDLALSVQVLQEFYVQATRQTRAAPLPHAQAVDLIQSWLRYPVQDLIVEILTAALSARVR